MKKRTSYLFPAILLIAGIMEGCNKDNENKEDKTDIGTILPSGNYRTSYKYTRQNGTLSDSTGISDTVLNVAVLSRVVVVIRAVDLQDTLFVKSTTGSEIILDNAKAADLLGTMTLNLDTRRGTYHKLVATPPNQQEHWYLSFNK